jgi:hypothetical protein
VVQTVGNADDVRRVADALRELLLRKRAPAPT